MKESFRSRSLRQREKREKRKKLILIGSVVAAVILLILIIFLFRGCGKKTKEENSMVNAENKVSEEEENNTFFEGIYIEDIAMEGMTIEEGKEVVLKKMEEACSWEMKVVHEEKSYEIPDIVSSNLDEIIEMAYQLGREEEEEVRKETRKKLKETPVYYTVEGEYDESIVDNIVEEVYEQFSIVAVSGDLIGYDKETKQFLYEKASKGYEVDKEDLKQQIDRAVKERRYDAVIQAKMNETEPDMDESIVKEKVKLLARFETTTTSNKDRNENIRLASEAMNGTVIKPGEVFSMNDITGERTLDKGYKPAGTIIAGKLVEEPGGGVCQVSSTIYNAVIEAGITTTERYSHSLEPKYVNPGEDAMVSYPNADLKFRNNSTSSVVVLIEFENQKLTASIYGIPVLEEGVTREMYSEKVAVIPMPEPEYIEDKSLKPGEEKIESAGKEGVKFVTYLITKKDGVEIEREFLHNSVYNVKRPVIRRNSSKKSEEKETKEPKKTKEPKESVEPEESLEPEETEEPEETTEPEETKKPEKTKKPEGTKEPEETKKPEETKEPVETEAPAETEEPVTTETPVVTETPVITEAPQSTEEPVVTPEPEAETNISGDSVDVE